MYGVNDIDNFIPDEMAQSTSPTCLFFILGAGASFDSGLPTYRGPEGLYNKIDPEQALSMFTPLEKVWEFLTPLYQKIVESKPGPTYEVMKELAQKYPDSFILTQNIDGHALSVGLPVVEMHGSWKTMSCHRCNQTVPTNLRQQICSCDRPYRPDIILYDEDLPRKKVQEVYELLKRRPCQTVVVGTTLQFPYLRTYITKAKEKGTHVVHINPDESYAENIKKRETWHDVPSEEGLKKLLD